MWALSVLALCNISEAAICKTTPSLAGLSLTPQQAAAWAGPNIALAEHAPCDIIRERKGQRNKHFQIRFVSGMTVLNSSAEQIRGLLMNPATYPDIFPNTDKARLIARTANSVTYELRHGIRLPLINWHTTLRSQMIHEADGSLLVNLVDGDIDDATARWEIIPLGNNRTLVVLTDWSNLTGSTWLYRLVLKAQPDLPAALPWIVTSSALESLRRKIEGNPQRKPEGPLPTLPEAAFPNGDKSVAKKLLEQGNTAVIAPGVWFQGENEAIPLRFVTVSQKVDSPMNTSRRLLGSLRRYHEFLKPVKSVKITQRPWGMDTHWQLGVSLGIFSTSPEYRISFWWQNPQRLYFHRTEGEMRYLFGAWEWEALDKNRTLAALTVGIDPGSDPGWLMGYVKYAPYPEINGALLSGLLTLKKAGRWIEKQQTPAVTGTGGKAPGTSNRQ